MKFSQDFLGILFINTSGYNAIWVLPTQTLLGKAISSSLESQSPPLVAFEVIKASEVDQEENDVGIPMIIKLLKGSVVAFHTPGSCGINLQATRCVLEGKSQVKVANLFLNPPFRLNS